MSTKLLLSVLLLPASTLALIGRDQSAGVEGILMCGTGPAKDVLVKLYDDDSGIDTDDLMAEGTTDSKGYFRVVGYTDEITNIDVKLNIYHDCDDGLTPCQRKITIWVPDRYVSSGKTPTRIYNIGTYDLSLKVKNVTLIGRTQSAGVRGYLMCGNKPAANVLVKLYDDDRGVDADDLMAEGRTDSRGHFQLQGHTDEFTKIDPKLNIYHDCENTNALCKRKVTFWIPDDYISSGETPSKIYDVGSINLALKYDGETHDCLH
uniref:Transthyretin-like family protein n=1 Tax=Enterobius vermicularis TaxID=51028 RepID=A0A0N4V0B6_ENTVE